MARRGGVLLSSAPAENCGPRRLCSYFAPLREELHGSRAIQRSWELGHHEYAADMALAMELILEAALTLPAIFSFR